MSKIKNNKTTKGVKKTSKIKQYQTNGKRIIKKGINDGYEADIIRVYGTTDVTEIVKSKRGLENLKQKMKAFREKAGVIKRNKEYDAKVERNKLVREAQKLVKGQAAELIRKYGKRSLIRLGNDKTYKNLPLFYNYKDSKKYGSDDIRMAIHEMKQVSATTHYANMMSVEVDEFFDKYFRELTLTPKYSAMLNEMKDNFSQGQGLADYYDFVDYITNDSFKGEFYGDNMEVDEYEKEMVNRLYKAYDAMVHRTYK